MTLRLCSEVRLKWLFTLVALLNFALVAILGDVSVSPMAAAPAAESATVVLLEHSLNGADFTARSKL